MIYELDGVRPQIDPTAWVAPTAVLIGNVIQTQFLVSGDWNFGSALSVIMMVMILIAMRIMNRFDSTDDKENALW